MGRAADRPAADAKGKGVAGDAHAWRGSPPYVVLPLGAQVARASSRGRWDLMPAGAPLLTLSGVSKHFGGLQVITDLDFVVNEEETVGLIGPNGAGKTTVFNLITSIYSVDRGSIRFQGQGDRRPRPPEDLPPGSIEDLPARPGLSQDVGLRERDDCRRLRSQAPPEERQSSGLRRRSNSSSCRPRRTSKPRI